MRTQEDLEIIRPKNGRPLHLAVYDALLRAIDSGMFHPSRRLPSTQRLSAQLKVSLVTTHRALQELVASGVVERTQGRGTFVQPGYLERPKIGPGVRMGLILGANASLADFHYCQIAEGIRGAAQDLGVDLILTRVGDGPRLECSGRLLVGMPPAQVKRIAERNRLNPIVAVDCRANTHLVSSIDIDGISMSRQAVSHLHGLGHRRIAYVGSNDGVCNGTERWQGFISACQHHGMVLRHQHVLRAMNWRLDDREHMSLVRMLWGPDRPTAVYVAGHGFVVSTYSAAATVGLCVPGELSILGVGDSPSAAHLSPPLTTFRQPLQELGRAGVEALMGLIREESGKITIRDLRAELVIRGSTAAPHA